MKHVMALLSLVWLIPAIGADLPSRKAGLWEIETQSAGGPGAQKIKQCVDAKTDAAMMQMGKDMNGKMGAQCKKTDFRKQGGKFISESDCTTAGMRMITRSEFSGDFSASYSGEVVTTYDPPMMGMKDHKTTFTAKWLGACEAGQQPGDVIMSNGMKMNMMGFGAQGLNPTR